MQRFTLRIGGCGFVAAWLLFAVMHYWGRSAWLEQLMTIFWPTSMLLAGHNPATRLSLGELFQAAFSALMNGAAYFGLAWLVWWVTRLGGITKAEPSAKDRFVSVFLAVGLGFTLLVALAEAAIRGLPKFTAEDLGGFWLVSANLFALMVITCATSGLTMWWLRNFLRGRQGGLSSAPPRGSGKL